MSTFPLLMIHAGECGYIASVSFSTKEVYDKKAWLQKAEELRQIIQILNDEYKTRFGETASIFDDTRRRYYAP